MNPSSSSFNVSSSSFNPASIPSFTPTAKPQPQPTNMPPPAISTPAFNPNQPMQAPQTTPASFAPSTNAFKPMNTNSNSFNPQGGAPALNTGSTEFKPNFGGPAAQPAPQMPQTPQAHTYRPPQQNQFQHQPAPNMMPAPQGYNFQHQPQYQQRPPPQQYMNQMPYQNQGQQFKTVYQPKQQTLNTTSTTFTPNAVNTAQPDQPKMQVPPQGYTWNPQNGQPSINKQFQVQNTQISSFQPTQTTLNVKVAEFKPFVPTNTTSAPKPVEQPKEQKKVEVAKAPPKDKLTEVLERIVAEDSEVKNLKEVFETQKKQEKWTSDLLRQFIKNVSKDKISEEVKERTKCYISGLESREMEQKSLKAIDSAKSQIKRGQQKRNYHQDGNNYENRRGGRGRGQNYQGNRNNEDQNMSIGGSVNYSHRREKRDNHAPENEFERKATDEMTVKLKQQAQQALQTAKQDKNVEQQIRLICNVIAPDNYEKKFAELRKHMFGDLKASDEPGYNKEEDKLHEENINKDQMDLIVKTIFRKAQNEPEYSNFYSHLCTQLTRLELRLRGIEPTVKNLSKCEFRKILLQFCKDNFLALINPKEQIDVNDQEAILKHKLRLFGNMKFVGELYTQFLIIDKIILNIFESLLGLNSAAGTNDDTIEGAILLINKVGVKFEEKIKKQRTPDSGANFEAIYSKFTQLRDVPKEESQHSLRVQLLIKNMLENRESGWKKTNQEDQKFKTKADIQKEVMKKAREEEEKRNGGRRGGDHYEDDDGYQHQGRKNYNNLQKQSSTYSNKSDQKQQYRKKDNQGKDGQRGEKRNNMKRGDREKQPKTEITEEEIAQKVKQFYKGFFDDEEEFDLKAGLQTLDEIVKTTQINGKPTYGEHVLFGLYNSVIDQNNAAVNLKVVIEEFIKNNQFNKLAYANSINRFLTVMPDWCADVPDIHKIFCTSIVAPLVEAKQVNTADIKWLSQQSNAEEEEEDDYFDSGIYYKIVSEFLFLHYNKEADWDKCKKYYQDFLEPGFKEVKAKGEIEDYIEDEIKEEYGDLAEKVLQIIKQ